MHANELKRLRQEFELQASRYTDLTLSVYFESADRNSDPLVVREPNHKIMLWQYLRNAVPGDQVDVANDLQMDRFGFVHAGCSAFAVIEGSETELFCRMASRAGSLIPDEVRLTLTTEIMAHVVDQALPGKPVFGANRDPLATWLNLVLVCLAVYQPERFMRTTLPVDPFAASLAAFDHVLNRPLDVRQTPPPTTTLQERRFEVSLSFPGERRPFVSEVANGLRERSVNVFYDQFFEAELARPDIDLLLQRIYHDNSQLVVVFLCREYDQKEWCGLEWRAIRDLIKRKRHNILLFRFDDDDVAGVFSIDGYVDLRDRTPQDAIDVIIQRTQSQVSAATHHKGADA